MAIESIASVKSKFETGDTPSQADFTDFIDTVGRASLLALASGVEGGGVGVVAYTTAATVTFHLVASAGSTILGTESISSVKSLLAVPTSAATEAADNTFTGSNTFNGVTTFSTAMTINATVSATDLRVTNVVRTETVSASSVFVAGSKVYPLTVETPQSAASATLDFTGIRSDARRIIVTFRNISTNGTSLPLVQLGDSGGIEASGYLGAVSNPATTVNHSTGFSIASTWAAAAVGHGSMIIDLADATNNVWVQQSALGRSDTATAARHAGGGSKTLSATLDRVRVTTINGTDVYDDGTVSIKVE